MKIHPSITEDKVEEAARRGMTSLDNPGFCVKCGADVEGVEPDAARYRCELCGERGVYGAESLFFIMGIGA